jgi:hypothetical protein
MTGPTLEALLDIEQIAEATQLPTGAARLLLDINRQPPAGSYRGKALWLRDSLDAVLAESAA